MAEQRPLFCSCCLRRSELAPSPVPPLRWAATLALEPYEPLRFFCPLERAGDEQQELDEGPRVKDAPPKDEAQIEEEICELGIRLKELELRDLLGGGFDAQRYKLLEAQREEKIEGLKARQKPKKQPPT